MLRAACTGMVFLWAGTVAAADFFASPENYRDYLPRLQPGDRLLLAPGDYRRGLPLHDLSGLAGRPIVIEAVNPAEPPRFIARPDSNTVSLVNVRHLALRHLRLDGRRMPVDAIKAEGHGRYADHVTLEQLHIHDHDASQQNVGISTKCPAHGWVVRNNRIERVGTGMYFGDSDGSDPFVAGIIESNRIVRTLGYNLQIKHQKPRPDASMDRHDTVIRYNVFSKSGALPGPLARPNVLLGHLPLAGAGSEDRYLVYGNLFLHNSGEALLQAEGRVAIYDNVFINGSGDAIHIQPHNDVPRDIDIFSNTVLASGTGIRVRQAEDAPYHQRVIANVVAAATPIQGGEARENVTLAYRADMQAMAVSELTSGLLAQARPSDRMPISKVRELAIYPDWPHPMHPGARIAPALLRAVEVTPP